MRIFGLFCLIACISIANAANNNGMVVSESKLASEVGIHILKQGGNAIDAAVAVGYALAVVNPCCGNIGGGGFMTIHLANGQNIFINFREKAPLKASAEMYARSNKHASTEGYLAVAVPGTVLGFETALTHYGTMQRSQVIAPAIRLAEQGFIITPYLANQLAKYLGDVPTNSQVAAIFFRQGSPYQAGESLKQPQLANTLKLISQNGPQAFYEGVIAQEIVDASSANGGILSLHDFKQYQVQVLAPVTCMYQGYQIISAAPPSSGGITLCETLNILENFPLKRYGYFSARSFQIIVEAMRYSFTDRNTQLGDPDFVNNPIMTLLDKKYARVISDKILRTFTPIPSSVLYDFKLTDTTHYSIVDKVGNAVSVTYTLNSFFGVRVIAGNTGFFLNNEMDDFTTVKVKPNKFGLVHSTANTIAPGKRPLSSMAPTIILRDNNLFMVLGSPGGPRIITAVLLTILNVIDFDMSLQDAINLPRYHYQVLPDTIYIEPFALSFSAQLYLQILGYHFTPQPSWSDVEAIMVSPDGSLHGISDYRRPDGAALSG